MILIATKKKIIILSIFVVVLIVLYYFLVINILQKGKEIYTLSQKIRETEAKKEYLLSMKENLSLSKDKAIQLENYILKVGGEVEFIKKIEDMALSGNVKAEIKTAKIEEVSSDSSTIAENFRVGLDAIGSWNDVIYFLTLIENLPFRITINSVSFDKFSDYEIKGQKVSQWLLNLDFSVIKQK